ncbi:MAG: hypothetical protein FWG26_08700 [Betaproteobacteria bacterium]|nr:hypothetical protein [Betaproteobacteria bacterium]
MDAKTYAEHVKNCGLCNRKGGLILLTLYGLASRDSNAPEVSGDFKVTKDGAAGVPLDEDTLYTQRFPGAGFVYVYDEENVDIFGKKAPWQGYASNELGFLTPFPIPMPSGYVHPAATAAGGCAVPCDPWAHEMQARCISVVKPDKPRAIWIGFSRTQWTPAVLKENEKESVRARHMREFDLGKWWGSGRHEHACSLEECDKHITEMAGGIKRGSFDFSHTPLAMAVSRVNVEELAKFIGKTPEYPATDTRAGELMKEVVKRPGGAQVLQKAQSTPKESLLRAAERLLGAENKHKAAVVALDDPAGILMDLNVYMDVQHQRYVDEILAPGTELGRKIAIADIIGNMKNGVKNDILGRCERQADGGSLLLRAHTHEHFRRVYGQLRDNPDMLEEAAKNRWSKYAEKIDEGKIKDSWTIYNNLLEAYDRDHTLPLARAYVKWFNSPLFASHMECSHDPANVESGLAYAAITSRCLGYELKGGKQGGEVQFGGAQDKGPVLEEVILPQLQDCVKDKAKVLARALVLNQDIDAEKVEKWAAQGVPSGTPIEQLDFWAKVIKEAGKAVEAVTKYPDARNNLIGRLTAQVGGGILKLQQEAIKGGPVPAWLVKFGYMGQAPIIKVDVSGNLEEVAQYLGKQYARASSAKGYHVSEVTTPDIFAARLKQAANGQTSFRAFVIPVDGQFRIHSSAIPALLQGKMSMEQFEKADYRNYGSGQSAGYLLRPGKLNDIQIFEREAVAGSANKAAAKALPAGASVLASILQVGVMVAAAGKLDEALAQQDKTGEAKLYFTAAAFGMIHAVGGAFERFAALRAERVRSVLGLTQKQVAFASKICKGFGFVGAGITVGLSVNNATKAYQNKQYGMMGLYLISAGASFAGGILIFSTTTAAATLGLPLFIIGVTISLAIAVFVDDELQEWLGRCVFGKDKAAPFPSLEAEMRVFERIYSNAKVI